MVRVELAAVAILAFFFLCEAARKVDVIDHMQRVRGQRDLSALSRDRRGELLGLGEGEALEPGSKIRTAAWTTKVRFQETYRGIPIEGASVVFEEDDNGGVTMDASGSLVVGVDDDIPDITPQLTATEAFIRAVLHHHDSLKKAQFDAQKDAILEVYLDESPGEVTDARLAYRLSYRVEKQGRLSRPFSIVDANTGDVIKQWEGLSFQKATRRSSGSSRVYSNYDFRAVGGNMKIGKANYDGKSFPKLEITRHGNGSCSLENNVAKVFHCNNSWDCETEAQVPYTFDCEEGLLDGINGGYSPLADALFYISATYEMFDLWYDLKDPLKQITAEDTASSVCCARIHYGVSFENAFWDGYSITFGDGNDTFYPLTSINIVAHEIAHGITEMNSALIYDGESGGINEAFSDMAGEAVEFYANSKPDWMIGYEIFKQANKAMRYFDVPEKDGNSIGNYMDYCQGVDVHYSSGVFNHAFYFLGKTKGWDVRKAFRPFLVANILYWMPTSKFYSAACDVVRAANDLGFNSDDVVKAFRKVGIEPCVESDNGLSTAEITVPAGHEVLIEVNVTDATVIDQMTITFYGSRHSMTVQTPNCEFCSRGDSMTGVVEICDIAAGIYMISLVPVEDLVKGMVTVTGRSENIITNGTLISEDDSFHFEFQMPEDVVQSGGQVLFQMTTDYGYPIVLVRYGEAPDVNNMEYDVVITEDFNSMLCNVKAGIYYAYAFVYTGVARGIDIDIARVLTGKRVDTPPVVTRPPPTTQTRPPTTTQTRSPSTIQTRPPPTTQTRPPPTTQTRPPPTTQTRPPSTIQTRPPPTTQTRPPPTTQTRPPPTTQTRPPSTIQTRPPPTTQTRSPPTTQIPDESESGSGSASGSYMDDEGGDNDYN